MSAGEWGSYSTVDGGGGAYSAHDVIGNVYRSPYAMDYPQRPEFIFPVENKKKSWNEKMFDRIGTSYMSGLGVGGVWGISEGVRSAEGRTFRLKMNRVVNGCTRRGPFLANTLGVLALLYSPLESAIGHLRGVDDSANSVAAASIAGVLYKCTAGVRPMLLAGTVGCALFGSLGLFNYFVRDSRWSFFSRTYL